MTTNINRITPEDLLQIVSFADSLIYCVPGRSPKELKLRPKDRRSNDRLSDLVQTMMGTPLYCLLHSVGGEPGSEFGVITRLPCYFGGCPGHPRRAEFRSNRDWFLRAYQDDDGLVAFRGPAIYLAPADQRVSSALREELAVPHHFIFRLEDDCWCRLYVRVGDCQTYTPTDMIYPYHPSMDRHMEK